MESLPSLPLNHCSLLILADLFHCRSSWDYGEHFLRGAGGGGVLHIKPVVQSCGFCFASCCLCEAFLSLLVLRTRFEEVERRWLPGGTEPTGAASRLPRVCGCMPPPPGPALSGLLSTRPAQRALGVADFFCFRTF